MLPNKNFTLKRKFEILHFDNSALNNEILRQNPNFVSQKMLETHV